LLELFPETDQTENLKAISVPVPVMHSDNDAIVPFADSGPLAAKLLKNGSLKSLQGSAARHSDDTHRPRQRGPAGCSRAEKAAWRKQSVRAARARIPPGFNRANVASR
jgi:hypothetical protein